MERKKKLFDMCRMLLMRIKREIKFWDNEHVINGLIGV